jgi:hypothetical protein
MPASGTTPDGSQLLRLGRYASPTQVYQAMCYDYANVYKTKSVTESAEEIAAAYNGWQFAGGSPAAEFEMDGCRLARPSWNAAVTDAAATTAAFAYPLPRPALRLAAGRR